VMVTVLSMQVFPVEGVCFLFGIGHYQEQIDKDLFSNTDETDSDEDPVKIKKQEYLSYLHALNQQFRLQSLLSDMPNLKIGIPIRFSPELLSPPPNSI
ncbi:MAG: hypothetical protein B7Y76_10605, partial [Sphingobacteriia bacterium 35-40-5]